MTEPKGPQPLTEQVWVKDTSGERTSTPIVPAEEFQPKPPPNLPGQVRETYTEMELRRHGYHPEGEDPKTTEELKPE